MSGQTFVEYGGIRVTHCHTLVFTQEAVLEEGDYVCTKYTVRVVGYIHGGDQGETVMVEPLVHEDAAGQFGFIRHRLMEPRQPFSYVVGANSSGEGGTALLEVFPFRENGSASRGTFDTKDVDSGPRCKVVELTQIIGTTIYRGEFEFEAHTVDCPRLTEGVRVKVLSNKWSLIDSIDGNRWTTRTWAGRLRLADANVSPHDFRHLCIPPLSQGMRRELMEFNASRNGLELDYRILDREAPGGQPPEPATSWAYHHKNSSADPIGKDASGYMLSSEFHITLAGDRNVDKQILIAMGAAMAEAKTLVPIQQEDVKDERKLAAAFIEHIEITDEVDDSTSRVHLFVRVLRAATIRSFNSVSSLAFGVPMDKLVRGVGVIGRDYDIRDSRGNWPGQGFAETEGPVTVTGAFSSFLQSGCDGIRDTASGVRSVKKNVAQKEKPKIKAFISDVRRESFPGYMSASYSKAMYVGYSLESTYHSDQMTVAAPIASFSGGSPSDGLLASVAHICLSPTVTTRTTRIFAMRVGQEPEFPPMQSFLDQKTGIRYVLLDSKIRKGEPKRTADGREIHRAWLDSEWSLNRAPLPGETLLVGANPMESVGVRRTNLTNSGIRLTEGTALT